MLLYRGRAIGCIATSRSTPDNQPTEVSLQSMLADLECLDTEVRVYDLPENIVLPMSALFLGYPVQRNDNYDGRAYTDYICNWFEGKKQTACLVISGKAINLAERGKLILAEIEFQKALSEADVSASDPNLTEFIATEYAKLLRKKGDTTGAEKLIAKYKVPDVKTVTKISK
jgi:hypothetical protein